MIDDIKEKVRSIITSFPVSHNGKHYLTLKNNQKMFFWLFIKKYWIDWSQSKYASKDLLRRMRCIEFFDYITKQYDVQPWDQNAIAEITTLFHKMIVIRIWKPWKTRWELLSFYPK